MGQQSEAEGRPQSQSVLQKALGGVRAYLKRQAPPPRNFTYLPEIAAPVGEPPKQLPPVMRPYQVTSPPDREQRLLQHRLAPPGTGDPVPTKRRHFRDQGSPPMNPVTPAQQERETRSRERKLFISPRFMNEFRDLPPEGKSEVVGSLLAIHRGKGRFYPLHNIRGGVKLHAGHEHGGNTDDHRIIFLPVEGSSGSFYAVAILPTGHDYGKNIIEGILMTIRTIPDWEQNGRIMDLEDWGNLPKFNAV